MHVVIVFAYLVLTIVAAQVLIRNCACKYLIRAVDRTPDIASLRSVFEGVSVHMSISEVVAIFISHIAILTVYIHDMTLT